MLTQVFRILGVVTLLLIAGCTEPAVDDPPANDTAEPSTARLDTVRLDTAYMDRSADGVLRVHWASTPADAPVALYVSDEQCTRSTPSALRSTYAVSNRTVSNRAVLGSAVSST
ncbi:MAG: hypothetical protein AAF752_15555, partial [Bacteroidota bacterium]